MRMAGRSRGVVGYRCDLAISSPSETGRLTWFHWSVRESFLWLERC